MAFIDPSQVTSANLAGQLPGLGTVLASIVSGLNGAVPSAVAVSTTGANIDLNAGVTELTVSGPMTGTLPNGTYVGQRVRVRCVAASASPSYVLTVTTPETLAGFACASTFNFTAAGQEIVFEWASTSKWRAVEVKRAGSQAVTIGTTVLTGISLVATYVLTMTGTNASTTTKGLPNGSAVGEICTFLVASAGGTTGATMSAAAYKPDGTTGTTITFSSATATADTAAWRWDGTLWLPLVVAANCVVS